MSEKRIIDCPLAHAAEVIGDWRTMQILHEYFEGRGGPVELGHNLGLPPLRLVRELEAMTVRGLIKRVPPSHGDFAPEYQLTDRAVSLRPVLIMLAAWANRQLRPEQRSMRLVDVETGREVEPVVMDQGSQVSVEDQRQFVFELGPAASDAMHGRFARAGS